jgi:hypothetical protein
VYGCESGRKKAESSFRYVRLNITALPLVSGRSPYQAVPL